MNDVDMDRAQREESRWRILKGLDAGRPYAVSETILFRLLHDIKLPLTVLDVRRELDYLADRGLVAPGYRADLNLIDLDRLSNRPPRMASDLPAGGRRLLQEAEGYVATVVAGTVTYEAGEPTGPLPGRLIRGPQPAPAHGGTR